MKVFETKQIRKIDEDTIRNEPISSVDLMERAAGNCASWICEKIQFPVVVKVFAGPGNNGGDGLVIARKLAEKGYTHISLYLLEISGIISPDAEINRNRLLNQGLVTVHNIRKENDFPLFYPTDLIIDALFGSGLTRPLEGLSQSLVKHMNNSGCKIISIDIPSGLRGEESSENRDNIIRAHTTLTFEFPKLSFFFAENESYTGSWHIMPIGLSPESLQSTPSPYFYLTADEIGGLIRGRKRFSHKGTYGHSLLIAGQYGMSGAAILAAQACLRSGTGLLTMHIPRKCYPIVQGVVHESIFSLDDSDEIFTSLPYLTDYTALGVGPGIGTADRTFQIFRTLLTSVSKPLVLDADALNLLSMHKELIGLIPPGTILTPHPKEFDRIAGPSENGFSRNRLQIDFAVKHNLIIILKGAYTSIALPDGRCFYNSTGNPGMATAGSGDVLTGILLALLAQGYSPEQAALLGSFIHGFAGDLASDHTGQHALVASDIIFYLGKAFLKFENHDASF